MMGREEEEDADAEEEEARREQGGREEGERKEEESRRDKCPRPEHMLLLPTRQACLCVCVEWSGVDGLVGREGCKEGRGSPTF